MWFKVKATVKKFQPKQDNKNAFAFVVLADKKTEVYVGPEVLQKARITKLEPGNTVKIKHRPSKKRPGKLEATVITA